MISREQSKCPIIFLLCLTFPSAAALISAIVVSYFKNYIGFLISNSTLFTCNAYLTYKLQSNNVDVLNVVIFGAGFSVVVAVLILAQLVYLLVKWCKCEQQYFQELSKGAVVRLYLGYSLLLMGILIGTAYFMSYIIEEGVQCFSSVDTNWIILGGLYGFAFILGLVCWIYVVCFWIRNFEMFQEEEDVSKMEKQKEQSSGRGNKVAQNTYIQELKQQQGQKKSSEQKSEQIQQEKQSQLNSQQRQNNQQKHFQKQLQKLLEQRQKRAAEQPPIQQTNNLKEPLIAVVDSSDQQSQHATKKKLEIVGFQQFINRQEKKKKKEEEKQQTINHLMVEKENQRKEKERKKKEEEEIKRRLMFSALSPDHPDFQKIFQEQDKKQEYQKEPTPEEEEEFYPANFIPSNQKQKKKFQKYKKKLYEKHKADKRKPGVPRHPQNIDGGRSKRLLKKFLQKSKKPNRNQSLLGTTPPTNSILFNQSNSQLRHINSHPHRQEHSFNKMIEEMSENSSSSSSSKESKVSGKFLGNSNGDVSRMEVPDTSRTFEMSPPSRPGKVEQMVQREPQTLFFSRQKIKIKNRKPLFEPGPTVKNEPPIQMIIKNMIHKSKQNEQQPKSDVRFRESRLKSSYLKGRKGQKLLDYIRSSFQ